MKFKPVFPKDKFMFVWEVTDVDIPDELNSIRDTDTWVPYGIRVNGQPMDRLIYEGNPREVENLLNDLRVKCTEHIKTQKDYDLVNATWPQFLLDAIPPNAFYPSLVKDLPGMSMGLHIDNHAMIGTFIINLEDNPDSGTQYFDLEKKIAEGYIFKNGSKEYPEPDYIGPTKKGTGILHLNSPYLWHTGANFSKTSTRYATIGQLANIGYNNG